VLKIANAYLKDIARAHDASKERRISALIEPNAFASGFHKLDPSATGC
jgi:hypothetical protein